MAHLMVVRYLHIYISIIVSPMRFFLLNFPYLKATVTDYRIGGRCRWVNITRQRLCLKVHLFSDGLASPYYEVTSVPPLFHTDKFFHKSVYQCVKENSIGLSKLNKPKVILYLTSLLLRTKYITDPQKGHFLPFLF